MNKSTIHIISKIESLIPVKLTAIDFLEANLYLKQICGVNNFFVDSSEYNNFLQEEYTDANSLDKSEFGDFQTPSDLSDNVCLMLKSKLVEPDIIIEPSCGLGAFIISALKTFDNAERFIGIEINKLYVHLAKVNILCYFIENPRNSIPDITILNENILDNNFSKFSNTLNDKKILLIGNPPWVTNSQLSGSDSINLPNKANIKKLKGIDAITGKGNFDIAENILLNLLNQFQSQNSNFAFLVKSIVVKNIVFSQRVKNLKISNIEYHKIDAKKEFNVSADAGLFLCKTNTTPSLECDDFDFYRRTQIKTFGWHNEKFVSNKENYRHLQDLDGVSLFEWRQGIKHDCSDIMELELLDNNLCNGKEELLEIEDDLLYAFLKSSDLNGEIINDSRKYTIVTQTKVGQATDYIKKYPKTYSYLLANLPAFEKRKSSIYKNKPLFSIFGVGDYSFKKYKVAISGFYKRTKFTLVAPHNDKAIQLDDTCYFIGFDNFETALIVYSILNHRVTQDFLNSIIFFDGKRPITKETLMRLDFKKLLESITFFDLFEESKKNAEKVGVKFEKADLDRFLELILNNEDKQFSMFAKTA